MNYRPITDVWPLARPKVKFFGAYPAGFLLRARALLGVGRKDCVLHVCSGKIREYKCGPGCPGNDSVTHFHGFGVNDITMDADVSLKPDYVFDARDGEAYIRIAADRHMWKADRTIRAVLADPPYLPEFAKQYAPGPSMFPTGDEIVKHSISVLPVGGRVGILSLGWPRYPKKTARQVALVAVYVGNGNLGRTFAVYERTA
jgi:hypothetical protein